MADILNAWGTLTDLVLTSLPSLADGYVWQSGDMSAPNPTPDFVRIYYQLVFNATPVAGDSLRFYFANVDGGSTPTIRDGNIGGTVGALSAVGDRAGVGAGCNLVKEHFWTGSHGATFSGSFDLWLPSPTWQVLVQPVGEALSSTPGTIRFQYSHPQA